MGRVYLPADELVRHGCTLKIDEHGRFVDADADLAALVRDQAARARAWYDEACACCRCWTAAAPPAPRRWPASTAGC